MLAKKWFWYIAGGLFLLLTGMYDIDHGKLYIQRSGFRSSRSTFEYIVVGMIGIAFGIYYYNKEKTSD